jgi:hypothetical protein
LTAGTSIGDGQVAVVLAQCVSSGSTLAQLSNQKWEITTDGRLKLPSAGLCMAFARQDNVVTADAIPIMLARCYSLPVLPELNQAGFIQFEYRLPQAGDCPAEFRVNV